MRNNMALNRINKLYFSIGIFFPFILPLLEIRFGLATGFGTYCLRAVLKRLIRKHNKKHVLKTIGYPYVYYCCCLLIYFTEFNRVYNLFMRLSHFWRQKCDGRRSPSLPIAFYENFLGAEITNVEKERVIE